METIFIYLIKSSGLVALFFIVYHFLLRRETFFTFHRWYLLIGLAISIVLPLYFIQKTIYIEPTNNNVEPTIEVAKNAVSDIPIPTESFEMDWFEMGFVLYGIITILLFLKIIYDVLSLYKMLHKRRIDHDESYLFVDINDDVTPFSFFKYIVYNSKLYAQNELESIIAHEKVHSSQGHSYDVLIARLFTVVFWFNPFIYWYKKAILQNLEYIADQNAIAIINDKKSYQMTLLKVVSNQNCLSITNNFNQSLIKKRIVMLNKNQSHRAQVWKFAIVIPILAAFVFLFQVKTVAQEMYSSSSNTNQDAILTENTSTSVEPSSITNQKENGNSGYVFDKTTTDNDLKQEAAYLKKELNIDFKYSNIKRNSNGEIIAIQLKFKTSDGKKGKTQQSLDTGILPILFRAQPSADGKYDIGFYDNYGVTSKSKNDMVVETNGNIPPATPATPATPSQPNLVTPVAHFEPVEPVTAVEQQKPKVIIFSNDNGDDIVITDNYKTFKVPGSPPAKLTDSSPILIIDGKVQSNPKATIEKIDVTKIKAVRIYDENEKESKGTPIKKIVITTK